MSTNFRDVNRTVSAGDVVISVAEIFDRLQTKVDPSTLEQLLRDIVSGRRNQVRPGELITAELINQILAQLEGLEVRVTSLEAGVISNPGGPGIGTATPVITQLIPPEGQPVRVGEELQVLGRDFGISTLTNSVLIDTVRVTSFKEASDRKLVFDIPTQITDVPAAGRPATLTVRNDTRTAQKPLSLRSALTLAGPVDVLLLDIRPATLAANNPATFRFRLRSRANLNATYAIAPQIAVAANQSTWQANVQVLNAEGGVNNERTISLDAGAEQIFSVRINPIPAGTDGTPFTLTVSATAPGSSGTSGPINATVGLLADLPDPAITALTFSSGTVLGPGSGGSVTATTIRLPATRGARVTLFAEFSEVANYQVTVALVSGATNWQMQLLTPPATTTPPNTFAIARTDLDSAAGRVPRFPEFSIGPAAGVTAGAVEIRIQRPGNTQFRAYRMNLEIGS